MNKRIHKKKLAGICRLGTIVLLTSDFTPKQEADACLHLFPKRSLADYPILVHLAHTRILLEVIDSRPELQKMFAYCTKLIKTWATHGKMHQIRKFVSNQPFGMNVLNTCIVVKLESAKHRKKIK